MPVKGSAVKPEKVSVPSPVGMDWGIDVSKKSNFLLGPLVTCGGMVEAKEGQSSHGSSLY